MSDQVSGDPFVKGRDSVNSMVKISLYPRDLLNYWRRCGLTADFGATFFSFCFHESETARNALSFILNEIVENAVKYSCERMGCIEVSLFEVGKEFIFEVSNWSTIAQSENFGSFVDRLKEEDDLSSLYFSTMEKNMENDSASGIGILTILNDYNISISVHFERDQDRPDDEKVITQVKIDSENLG